MANRSDKTTTEQTDTGGRDEGVRVVGLRAKNSSVVEHKGELYYYEIADGKLAEVVQVGVGVLTPEQITTEIQNAIQADARAMG